MTSEEPEPLAVVGDRLLTDLVDVTDDLAALDADADGWWAVVLPFAGRPVCARFRRVAPRPTLAGASVDARRGRVDDQPGQDGLRSRRADDPRRDRRRRRLPGQPDPPALDAACADGADVAALGAALAEGNPAPYAAVVRLPAHGIARRVGIAGALPVAGRRQGRGRRRSRARRRRPSGFLPKDRAENVMIVDLVRNDLGRVCEWGSVDVPALCAVETHPGLVPPRVDRRGSSAARRSDGPDAIDATFPPGSVTGAPKIAALDQIARLEPAPRGVYCGAVGWVDAGQRRGDAQRRHPHVLVRRRPAALRHRRRHHLGLRSRPASGTRPS